MLEAFVELMSKLVIAWLYLLNITCWNEQCLLVLLTMCAAPRAATCGLTASLNLKSEVT
jgi:hypothetical protein